MMQTEWQNSVDPCQTAPEIAVWFGSTLFAQTCQKILNHCSTYLMKYGLLFLSIASSQP